MIFDEVDIKVLKELYFLEETGTREIARVIFPKETKTNSELDRKADCIKKRLISLNGRLRKFINGESEDLIKIEKGLDGKWEYTLIKNNIKFKESYIFGKKQECFFIKPKEKWIIFQI